jgi:programmed cell death 6-interacting protein
MTKYRRVYQNFNDLIAGLLRAQTFYSEMKDTVSSLQKNVETFVQNRRGEGGQLLSRIEQSKSQGADQEQQRLKNLMDRMSIDPSGSPVSHGSGGNGGRKKSIPPPLSSTPDYHQPSSSGAGAHPAYNPAASPPITPRYPVTTAPGQVPYMSPGQQSYGAAPSHNGYQQPARPRRESYNSFAPSHQQRSSQSSSAYNPAQHQHQYNPTSPPPHQQFFSPPQQQQQQPWGQPPQQQNQWGAASQPSLPQGYVPPPPPPGPPPAQDYSHFSQGGYPNGPGGYAAQPRQGGGQQGQQGQNANDPWAGLSGWK